MRNSDLYQLSGGENRGGAQPQADFFSSFQNELSGSIRDEEILHRDSNPSKIVDWIAAGAHDPRKEAYNIAPGRSSEIPCEVLYQGQWVPASVGFVFVRNRENGSSYRWTSSSNESLACNVLIRWRPKKGGVAFGVVFSSGETLTSESPVDVATFVLFKGAASPSAFMFCSCGGTNGVGGFCFTTDQKVLLMGLSFARLLDSFTSAQPKHLNEQNGNRNVGYKNHPMVDPIGDDATDDALTGVDDYEW